MKKLTEADIIAVMREEWDKRVQHLTEEIDLVLHAKDGGTEIVSPELKILHKKSGILYTVNSVGPRDVVLRTPEGANFIINKDELEQDYELA